jgi:curved DNA-binding protein CbpA
VSSDASDDYYALLGIEPHCDDAELRRAWRRLAMRWHPDRAGADVTFVFQKLLAAYNVLSDPDARAAYDRKRRIVPPSAAAPPPDPPPRRRAPGVMIRRLCGPLNALLARGVARQPSDELVELFLDPLEVKEGGMITISMRVMVHDVEDLFAAWLAVPPDVAHGTMLKPSALLPGMRPVAFRVLYA